MQLPVKILIGLLLGIFTGLFLGEDASFFKIFGDIFVMALQMTVLPYIMVSLITGLGGLSAKTAVLILKRCGWVLLLLWLSSLVMVLIMPFGFPDWQTSSFFSTSLIEKKPEFNLLEFYIPVNVFHSLSENIVPAVVVFSLALGIALMYTEKKEAVLDVLSPIGDALGKITNKIVLLAPYGVFSILASAMGTMRFEDLEKLQVYLLVYTVVSLVLTFWILPVLVTSLTSFRYKELVSPARTALITAFATGNLFIVLPILVDISKKLLQQADTEKETADSTIEVIVPASYSFPSAGKLLSLGFILFAGWMSNSMIPVSEYPEFLFNGFFNFFGNLVVAIPALLDMFRIPADTFQFFLIVDNLVGARFGVLLAAMFTLVLSVLGASSIAGIIRIKWRKLIINFTLTILIVTGSIGSVRLLFELVLKHEYKEYETLVSMEMINEYPKPVIYRNELPYPIENSNEVSRLNDIKQRGFIRVGYFSDALPFAFTNEAGNLVGLDIEMAHILARDMNVKLELVHINRKRVKEMLDQGYVDIVMSGMYMTLEHAAQMGLSTPYLNQTLAFIVKDYQREKFNSRDAVKKIDSLRIGIINAPYYVQKVKQYLPDAEITFLNSPREFFTDTLKNLDAMVYSAEAGTTWSLIYPEYTIAIPYPDVLEVPLSYAYKFGDSGIEIFLDHWIELKKKDKTIDTLYDRWILGKSGQTVNPRWSIMKDVLHWGNQ